MVAYLVVFATLSKVQQQTLVIQWINYSDIMRRMLPFGERLNPKVFLLPGTKEMIQVQALQRILSYGRDVWKTIKYYAKKNEIPKHGLIAKHGNKMNIFIQEELFGYFTETKQHAVPRATQLVRRMTQREEEAEAKYLDVMSRKLPFGERLNTKVFLLPGTKEMICGQALQRIIGYGRDAWKTIKYYAKNNEIPKHGLIGKHGNKMSIVMQEELFC